MNDFFFFTHTREVCYALMVFGAIGSLAAAVLWGLVTSAPL